MLWIVISSILGKREKPIPVVTEKAVRKTILQMALGHVPYVRNKLAATGIDRSKIELAASYYAAYPADVDERVQLNEEASERLRRALGVTSAA